MVPGFSSIDLAREREASKTDSAFWKWDKVPCVFVCVCVCACVFIYLIASRIPPGPIKFDCWVIVSFGFWVVGLLAMMCENIYKNEKNNEN